MEAMTRLDQAAVTLPASGPVVEGLLKMMAGQLITSDERHTLKEVHTHIFEEKKTPCLLGLLFNRWSVFLCCLVLGDQMTS